MGVSIRGFMDSHRNPFSFYFDSVLWTDKTLSLSSPLKRKAEETIILLSTNFK